MNNNLSKKYMHLAIFFELMIFILESDDHVTSFNGFDIAKSFDYIFSIYI